MKNLFGKIYFYTRKGQSYALETFHYQSDDKKITSYANYKRIAWRFYRLTDSGIQKITPEKPVRSHKPKYRDRYADGRFCAEHGVSYDDVHDFDK
jgi:hypothetical protein